MVTLEMLKEAEENARKAREDFYALQVQYKQQQLEEKNLCNDVIQVSSGRKGKISIIRYNGNCYYNYEFHHYTAKGTISKVASGYVPDNLNGYEPAP